MGLVALSQTVGAGQILSILSDLPPQGVLSTLRPPPERQQDLDHPADQRQAAHDEDVEQHE